MVSVIRWLLHGSNSDSHINYYTLDVILENQDKDTLAVARQGVRIVQVPLYIEIFFNVIGMIQNKNVREKSS